MHSITMFKPDKLTEHIRAPHRSFDSYLAFDQRLLQSLEATSSLDEWCAWMVKTLHDSELIASNASSQVNDTGTHGMFFRINGAALYSRGANMVPMVRRPSLATIWTCMMRSP